MCRTPGGGDSFHFTAEEIELSEAFIISFILCEVEEELESSPKALVYVHSETLSFQMIE